MAQIQWWIQDKFNVLPTDQRFKDLTDAQMSLLWIQHAKANPHLFKKNSSFIDEEYETAEQEADSGMTPAVDEYRDPIQPVEHYEDSDFEDAWNRDDDEEDPNEFIPENAILEEFSDNEGEVEEEEVPYRPDLVDPIEDDWEEV